MTTKFNETCISINNSDDDDDNNNNNNNNNTDHLAGLVVSVSDS